jgi:hypothetical protein
VAARELIAHSLAGDNVMTEHQYWIAVVPQGVVERALAGGYAELSHGQAGILQRLRTGDGLAFYSPRRTEVRGNAVQAFTALGHVTDGVVYEAQQDDGTRAARLAMSFARGSPAPIRPLLDELTFIRSRQHWGVALRHGARRIPAADFERIARAMHCAGDAIDQAAQERAMPVEVAP